MATDLSDKHIDTMAQVRDAIVEYQPQKNATDRHYASLQGQILLTPSAKQFLVNLDPVELMTSGNAIGIDAAIRLAIYQRAGAGDPKLLARPIFGLGGQFAQSLMGHGFGGNDAQYGKVLRACVGDGASGKHARDSRAKGRGRTRGGAANARRRPCVAQDHRL